jgi:hypothetical protein
MYVSLYVCMYCMYVCVCVCMYTHTHTHKHTHTAIYSGPDRNILAWSFNCLATTTQRWAHQDSLPCAYIMHACKSLCVRTNMHTYACTHTDTHVHTSTRGHTRTHNVRPRHTWGQNKGVMGLGLNVDPCNVTEKTRTMPLWRDSWRVAGNNDHARAST